MNAPLSPADLVVRPPKVYRLGECRVWSDQNRIGRGDEMLRIEPKSMDVLNCLAARHGETLSRDALLAAVWPKRVVVDETLSRCIAQVRAALGDNARSPRYIETVAKRGYRLLVAPVAETAEVARVPSVDETELPTSGDAAETGEADPVPETDPTPLALTPPPPVATRRPLLAWAALGVALLISLGAGVYAAWPALMIEGAVWSARAAIAQRGQELPASSNGLRQSFRSLPPASRVLWVDDHPENNRLEMQALERAGVWIVVAHSNAEAAEQMRGREFHLVVSDIGRDDPQPQRSGLDLPRELVPDRNRLPPLIYYVTKVDSPRSPDGYPVTNRPEQLFREMSTLLRWKTSSAI